VKGKLQIETVASVVLKGNPLGDPSRREVPVYLPPSYGRRRGVRFPVVYYLPGFTGGGRNRRQLQPLEGEYRREARQAHRGGPGPRMPARHSRLLHGFRGSQYLNSSATGRYEDHVVEELVRTSRDKFSLRREPSGRAVMGQSERRLRGSHARHEGAPAVFGQAACHSGDLFFEVSYGSDIPKFVAAPGPPRGSAERFARSSWRRSARTLSSTRPSTCSRWRRAIRPIRRAPWASTCLATAAPASSS